MMPSTRNVTASPAIRPPPRSDMVLMSDTSGTAALRRRSTSAFHAEEKMPPAPNQKAVHHSTKPPKLEAYGLGMMMASRMKSAVLVAALRVFHARYAALAKIHLRSTSVTTPIAMPRPISLSAKVSADVRPRSTPANLYVMALCQLPVFISEIGRAHV